MEGTNPTVHPIPESREASGHPQVSHCGVLQSHYPSHPRVPQVQGFEDFINSDEAVLGKFTGKTRCIFVHTYACVTYWQRYRICTNSTNVAVMFCSVAGSSCDSMFSCDSAVTGLSHLTKEK